MAAKEHYEAAQAYHKCAEEHSDPKVGFPLDCIVLSLIMRRFQMRGTLTMLYNNHCKVGKELQRKIEALRKEGKDPNSARPSPPRRQTSAGPSKSDPHALRPASPSSSHQAPRSNDMHHTVDESFMLLGRVSLP
jgi:hypothetical protein